jgi:hypothetical protein
MEVNKSESELDQEYFGLFLAPVKGRPEEKHLVATAKTQEELLKLMVDNSTDPYMDTEFPPGISFKKFFKQGSILEWYRPPLTLPSDEYKFGVTSVSTLSNHIKLCERQFCVEILGRLL